MDWILVTLGLLLMMTLMAFLLGYFPYPFGWLLFAGMFALRWHQLSQHAKRQR